MIPDWLKELTGLVRRIKRIAINFNEHKVERQRSRSGKRRNRRVHQNPDDLAAIVGPQYVSDMLNGIIRTSSLHSTIDQALPIKSKSSW